MMMPQCLVHNAQVSFVCDKDTSMEQKLRQRNKRKYWRENSKIFCLSL